MPIYNFDSTGTAVANRITGEQKALTPTNNIYNLIVPTYSPFYAQGLSISYRDTANNVRTLVEGQDYILTHQYIGASRAIGKPVYGSIELLNLSITGVATLVYQTLGGEWAITPNQLTGVLGDILRNPRTTTWEVVANVPTVFPPVPHAWDNIDMVGEAEIVAAINAVAAAIAAKVNQGTTVNLPAFYPSKEKVGLGNVDNYKTATDAESLAGSSSTRFMSPRGVALYVAAAILSYEQQRSARLRSATVPTTGTYTAGDFVECTDLTLRTWGLVPESHTGVRYLLRGWRRMTTSATHVLGTDWIEDRCVLAI
jgi:hypothetical protein